MMGTSHSFLIGIDGGGTKAGALLADRDGRVLGRGTGGPSNYQVVGMQVAGDSMEQAIRAAFADAKIEAASPPAIFFGGFRGTWPATRSCDASERTGSRRSEAGGPADSRWRIADSHWRG